MLQPTTQSQKQPTGHLLKSYLTDFATRMQHSGAMRRLQSTSGPLTVEEHPAPPPSTPLPIISDPDINIDPSLRQTIIAPITAVHRHIDVSQSRFIVYRSGELDAVDDPMTLLHGATIRAIQQLGAIPDELFISPLVQDIHKRQAQLTINVADGDKRYRFCSGSGRITVVTLRNDSELPTFILLALGQVHLDDRTVIAVCF